MPIVAKAWRRSFCGHRPNLRHDGSDATYPWDFVGSTSPILSFPFSFRYMSFLIYIAVYIYSRRRLTSPTTWCQSRRIHAFTDLCGRQHNSWHQPRPPRTRCSRGISWGRHTSSVCPFSRDRNHNSLYIAVYNSEGLSPSHCRRVKHMHICHQICQAKTTLFGISAYPGLST